MWAARPLTEYPARKLKRPEFLRPVARRTSEVMMRTSAIVFRSPCATPILLDPALTDVPVGSHHADRDRGVGRVSHGPRVRCGVQPVEDGGRGPGAYGHVRERR